MGSSLFSQGITAAVRKAVGMVKRRGGVISFDPNIRPEILKSAGIREALRSILEQTDVFLPSGDEVGLLVDAQTEAEAIEPLLALGIREIVVKHGSAGCTYYDRSCRLEVPAFAVREVDPTGKLVPPLATLRLRQWRDCRDAQRSHGGHCELCGIGHAHGLRRPAFRVLFPSSSGKIEKQGKTAQQGWCSFCEPRSVCCCVCQ
jgi:hypothetical protein